VEGVVPEGEEERAEVDVADIVQVGREWECYSDSRCVVGWEG